MVTIEQHVWGMTPEGEAIILYTMRNDKGAEVKISNFGAAIVSVTMPDREGRMADVVLGYKHPEGYFFDGAASGKSVGRCANRIASGRMTIEGKEYSLEVNNGPNHLHGGTKNFANRLWESRVETNRRRHVAPVGGRRPELPRRAERRSRIRFRRRQCPGDHLPRQDGQDDGREPHEPRLFQSRGRRKRFDPRPRTAPEQLEGARNERQANPDREIARRSGHPAGLPPIQALPPRHRLGVQPHPRFQGVRPSFRHRRVATQHPGRGRRTARKRVRGAA